ncbi:unnamed protein product [Psylliodes chrysocephalus]|uniref:DUF243 domain-containing protein n=1 Tax=Psylliodes chrysocephalus TaxID=3402493 RepID=A0A9P0CCP4_9CUCU|nr:unnamed protein product [Psylliodes chrysocephala]
MNLILTVTATLFTVTLARPQYNYPTPSQLPSGNYGAPSGGGFGGGIGGGGLGGGIGGGGLGGGIGGGGIGGGIGGGGIGGGIGGGGISEGISGGGISGGGIGGGGIGGGGIGGGGLGGSGFGGGIGGGGGGGVLVQKHIYVHVAPPEPEEIRPQGPISVGQATKHYKIIFIKAPSAPAPTAQSIALAAQNQEKTIIYVLVKKPEAGADISIPTIAPTQPSKPEVYFIKYKAKNEVVGGGTSIGTSGSSIGGTTGIGGPIETGSSGSNIGSSIQTGSSGISNIGVGTGSIGGRPSTQYGPPGQSGPY